MKIKLNYNVKSSKRNYFSAANLSKFRLANKLIKRGNIREKMLLESIQCYVQAESTNKSEKFTENSPIYKSDNLSPLSTNTDIVNQIRTRKSELCVRQLLWSEIIAQEWSTRFRDV